MRNLSFRYTFILTLSLAFLLSCSTVTAQIPDGSEVVSKANNKLRGNTSEAELMMRIVRPSWEREIGMKTWTRGNDYTMIYIQAPARDEGTAYLKRGNEMWNWVPKVGRVVKLPPSMMMQSWMGSDFTNDDLVEQASIVTDYTHKVLGDTTIRNYDCWTVELTPKENAAVVWSRIVMHVSKDEYLELRTEFCNEDDEIVNLMRGMDVKEFDQRTIPSRFEMIPMDKEDQKTVLIYQSIKFNTDIPENFFSIQNMKRID